MSENVPKNPCDSGVISVKDGEDDSWFGWKLYISPQPFISPEQIALAQCKLIEGVM